MLHSVHNLFLFVGLMPHQSNAKQEPVIRHPFLDLPRPLAQLLGYFPVEPFQVCFALFLGRFDAPDPCPDFDVESGEPFCPLFRPNAFATKGDAVIASAAAVSISRGRSSTVSLSKGISCPSTFNCQPSTKSLR